MYFNQMIYTAVYSMLKIILIVIYKKIIYILIVTLKIYIYCEIADYVREVHIYCGVSIGKP